MHWGVLEPKVAVRSVELLMGSVASVQTPNNFQNSIVDLQAVMLCKARARYSAFPHHHSVHTSSVTAVCLDLPLQNHSHCFLRLLFPRGNTSPDNTHFERKREPQFIQEGFEPSTHRLPRALASLRKTLMCCSLKTSLVLTSLLSMPDT